MFFSASVGAFFSPVIHGDKIPHDAVKITSKKHQELLAGQAAGKVISSDCTGNPVLIDSPPKKDETPPEITMRQCRLILHREQLLPMVQSAINELDEPKRTEAQIEWDYASSVRRDSEIVFILAAALGIEDTRLDNLFLAASKL